MAKPAPQAPPALPLNLKAVVVFKVQGDSLLCEAAEIEIKDGVVISMSRLNRGPDLPASAMGQAQRVLWSHFKYNTYVGQ